MSISFTTRALAAAIALAAGSAQATTLQTTASGNSSMLLAVWDNVRDVSYVRDLGINYLDFLPPEASVRPGPSLRVFATTALFASTFAGSQAANINWGVAGGERVGVANLAITRRIGETPTPTNTSALASIGGNIDNVVNDANLNVTPAGFVSFATDAATMATPRAVNDGDLLGAAVFAGVWFGGIGEYLAFHNYRGSTLGNFQAGTTQTYNALFHLAADGTLSYVPVPAAVWLLGSALVGMAGVARRRAD